jgi:hypothetical protein
MALLRYCPGICLEGLRKPEKISVRIADVPAEIREYPVILVKSDTATSTCSACNI